MKTTKEILDIYEISRQTLNNWLAKGLISKPNKDWRGWNVWTDNQILEINTFLKNKSDSINDLPTLGTVNINNRRYLGSKKRLLYFIEDIVKENTKDVYSIADIFGGTGVVADLFRQQGKKIIINDILTSNYTTYQTWFGNETVNKEKIKYWLEYLNQLETHENYVSENFGDKYFSLENAKKIGSIREKIEEINDLNEREKSFLLTSLIYAMDKVANTVGHYDAYRKKMDMHNSLELKMPDINFNRDNEIYQKDANELVREIKADLVYIDTPYNSRQYGDAYHLLENIIEWKKPDLSGVAMKMVDRSKTKSHYSTSKAPIAFTDLINNIKAKYILVSYNNMANKGNGRSNAKISNEEIIEILKTKGKVKVFETNFQPYSTGKSSIENHKELLYLCEVPTSDLKKGKKTEEYVTSAINYTGSKFKLLPQIMPHLPRDYDNFIDLFAGGASVGINSNPNNKVVINDKINPLINLYRYLFITDTSIVLDQINQIIIDYKFSLTSEYGYKYYGADSSGGLGKINKESYLKMRADYNSGEFTGSPQENIILYLLTVYGFNNQIRFNKHGEFNLPVGKRDFNSRMKIKLVNFMSKIKSKDIIFTSNDFKEVTPFSSNDVVYADPPYSISTATYTENNSWSLQDDLELYNYLDKCHENGVKFVLSNVSQHKGIVNENLLEWSKKYKTQFLNFNYNNSNYQSTAKNKITHEVLITNY